jgi:hypothetical protein
MFLFELQCNQLLYLGFEYVKPLLREKTTILQCVKRDVFITNSLEEEIKGKKLSEIQTPNL